MKSVFMGACGVLVAVLAAAAETEVVDGVAWLYEPGADGVTLVRGDPAYAGDLVVPATLGGRPVTSIDTFAFGFNPAVTSVELPAGVTNLPFQAFCSCTSLTNLVLRAPRPHLGESCLSGTALRGFAVPEGETDLETDVFHGAAALASVTLPSTLRTVGRSAFRNCTALTEIRFPAGFEGFGAYGWNAHWPFDGCTGLADVYFFGPVPANFDCSGLQALEDVRIHYPRAHAEEWAERVPAEKFGGFAGEGGPDAEGVCWQTVAGVTWRYVPVEDGACLVRGDPAYAGDLVVPATLGGRPVTSIDTFAFGFNPAVTSVELPAGVTNLPFQAFCSCTSLTNLVLRAPRPHLGESCLSGTALRGFAVPEGETDLETDVFHGAAALASVTLPSTLRTVGRSAFRNCTALTEIRFPAGFEGFGAYGWNAHWPFDGCTGLADVYFFGPVPANFDCSGLQALEGVRIHCSHAFADDWADVVPAERLLDDLDEGDVPGSGGSEGGDPEPPSDEEETVLVACVDGVDWRYVVVDGGARVVRGDPAYAGDLVVPAELDGHPVTTLDASAFGFNPSVTSVTLPAGVTNLPFHAFCSCASLTNVVISAPSFHLGESCLSGTAVRSFTVSEGETRLEHDVFHGDAVLASVALPSTLRTMGRSVFRNCTALTEVRFPAGFEAFDTYERAEQWPFDGCEGLSDSYFFGPPPANFATSGLLEHGLVHYPREYAEAWEALVPADRFGGYSDGEAQPLPPCRVRILGFDGPYDGQGHGVAVADLTPGADVVYAPNEAELRAGRGLPEGPVFTNVVDVTVWYQASASNHLPVTGTAAVRIRPRPVTLASRGGWKAYDGQPLVRDGVTAGGLGFIPGEGVEVQVTGSQTEIGASDNVFTWNPLPGTVTSNYEIAVQYGRLWVTKGPLGAVIKIR